MSGFVRSLVVVLTALSVALQGGVSTVSAVGMPGVSDTEVSPLPHSLRNLLSQGIVTDGTASDAEASYLGVPPGTLVVVTPGTEDLQLYTRLSKLLGVHPVAIVEYSEAFWPVMSGKSGAILPIFAPTFDTSRRQAVAQNLTVMRALQDDTALPYVLYTGYSQGAVALGDAVELAYLEELLDDNDHIYLTSDGRGPWGIMPRLQEVPFMSLALLLLGVSPDGVRNPADMGDVRVTDVIVTADSIANFQWKDSRVEESIFINILGYVVCHGDPLCYGDLAQHGPPVYLESVDGNVTYEIYHSLHPVTMAYLRICSLLSLPCGEVEIAAVDWLAEAWYKIEPPTVRGAAVPVRETTRPPQSPSQQGPSQDNVPQVDWVDESPSLPPRKDSNVPPRSDDQYPDSQLDETVPVVQPADPSDEDVEEVDQPDVPVDTTETPPVDDSTGVTPNDVTPEVVPSQAESVEEVEEVEASVADAETVPSDALS